jgi:hypothetical protein
MNCLLELEGLFLISGPIQYLFSVIPVFEGAGECYAKLFKLQLLIGQKYTGVLVFNVTSLDKSQFPFSNPGSGCL